MLKFNQNLMLVSFVTFLVAFFNRNELSENLLVLPQLQSDPVQIPTKHSPFSTQFNEVEFDIIPKYDYELFGLVVSYRLHESDYGQLLHALSEDHINVADFCVVWADSANPEILREFEFSNAQFTCYFQTRSSQAWEMFNPEQISNNHLLATDEAVRATIDDIKIGDQIHIKGMLADYQNQHFNRATSTSRTDTGNGACETTWVQEINILSNMNNLWRQLMWLSMGLLMLSLFVYFKAPFQPHR